MGNCHNAGSLVSSRVEEFLWNALSTPRMCGVRGVLHVIVPCPSSYPDYGYMSGMALPYRLHPQREAIDQT